MGIFFCATGRNLNYWETLGFPNPSSTGNHTGFPTPSLVRVQLGAPEIKKHPKGCFLIGATGRTRTGNLSRALIQYFHKGVDYIFTIGFCL